MCGENFSSSLLIRYISGSSPRVRGKLSRSAVVGIPRRLIPACAGKTPAAPSGSASSGAHPRVCGENQAAPPPRVVGLGSSPRVRGKPAGRSCPVRAPPAHPRVCGENWTSTCGYRTGCGSSPRVRGKRGRIRPLRGPRRLIPACAGKTCDSHCVFLPSGAHPRVCGENGSLVESPAGRGGSSPRVRGKQNPPGPDASDLGLIPACAGKTLATPAMLVCLGAHPRVCGENLPRSTTQAACRGSSPRVRGKQRGLHDADQGRRLIPACAGKTPAAWALAAAMTAHPRVCGENRTLTTLPRCSVGSSPRVRGKPVLRAARAVHRRLIPACAGKTSHPQATPGRPAAHPRVCGENAPASRSRAHDLGSSPRVRGKPHPDHSPPLFRGLIPACAGKTT